MREKIKQEKRKKVFLGWGQNFKIWIRNLPEKSISFEQTPEA